MTVEPNVQIRLDLATFILLYLFLPQMLRTPLHYAYSMQDGKEIQEWLIESGANENSRDFVSIGPIYILILLKNVKV